MSHAPTLRGMREDEAPWEPAVPGRRRRSYHSELWLRTFYHGSHPERKTRCRAYLTRAVRDVLGEWVRVEWQRGPDGRPVAVRLSRAEDGDGALHLRTDKTIEGGVFAVEGMPAMRIELREEEPGILIGELPETDPRAWERPA